MSEDNVKCPKCGSSFNRMYLIGKQGNANVCPMCGADMEIQSTDEQSDWITWWYLKDKRFDNDYTLWNKMPIDPENYEIVKEFKAPPESECGLDEVKRILRTYVPDAFIEPQEAPKVKCPYCFSSEVQIVPKKFSLLTGFATNKFQRVCVRCKRKF